MITRVGIEVSNFSSSNVPCINVVLPLSKNPVNKLSDPINLDSPIQIAILLYDVMGIKPVDDDKPRGTGEEILKKINNSFTEALWDLRRNH